MVIKVKQIDPAELTSFVTNASSGSIGAALLAYLAASGNYLGPLVVYTTGDTTILGTKTFSNNPVVNYTGGPTTAVQQQYFLDTISGSIALATFSATGNSVNLHGNQIVLDYKIFTGAVGVGNPSIGIHAVNLSFLSGVSGILAAGGGGGSTANTVQLTGYQLVSGQKDFVNVITVPVPTITSGAVPLSMLSGASGVLQAALAGAGANGTGIFVQLTGSQIISGIKTFTGMVVVGTPTSLGGAINVSGLSGASGALSQVHITGGPTLQFINFTGEGGTTVYTIGSTVFISGSSGDSSPPTINIFNITGTGTINNTFNASGGITNTFNEYSTIITTGSFVNMSFYFDQFNLATGLNQIEAFVSRNFTFTGFALGVINLGTNGFLSGSLYQRTQVNSKTNFADFSLNNGAAFTGVGGFTAPISGLNRVGVDVFLIGTGITGLSIGVFGIES